MFEILCDRAELDSLKPGSSLLDLGCGWRSCSLFIAKKYPKLQIQCVSNSSSQREFILERAKWISLKNIEPKTINTNVMKFKENSHEEL